MILMTITLTYKSKKINGVLSPDTLTIYTDYGNITFTNESEMKHFSEYHNIEEHYITENHIEIMKLIK